MAPVELEFVVVNYPTTRYVRLDGQVSGMTNDTLRVERGRHIFDLDGPRNYRPLSVEKDVQDTTVISPLVVDDFHPYP